MLQRVSRATAVIGLVLALAAGAAHSAEPANLSPHKDELAAYVNSGEYAKDVAAVALRANKYLTKRIARGAKPGKKLAVVFDIDETTLANLPHLIANDYGFVRETWDKWVAASQARAIIPVQIVYDAVIRAKVDVFFITGRPERARAATEKNLREVGYESWTKAFFTEDDGPRRPAADFKSGVRRKLTEEGYVIIANIGDQESDLAKGYAERTFKLPNPFYRSK